MFIVWLYYAYTGIESLTIVTFMRANNAETHRQWALTCMYVCMYVYLSVSRAELELVCIAAPLFTQPISLALSAFVYGLALLLSSALVASQRFDNFWSFYFGPEPTNGLSAYVMITVLSLVLLIAYWLLAHLYHRLELVVLKPYNAKILGKKDFPARRDPSSVGSMSINYGPPRK